MKPPDIKHNLNSRDSLSSLRILLLNEIFAKNFETKQELLDFSLTQVLKLTQSKYGYIYYYSEETKLFELNSWSKEVMPDCEITNPQTCYELDKTGFWGEAVRQRKSLILNNFKHPHSLKKGYPEGHVSISNFMTAPIFTGDKIVAVVGAANKKGDYTEIDTLEAQELITAVWEISKNIELSNKYAQIFKATEQAETSIVITNIDGNIEHVNPFFTKITGYSYQEAIGKNPRILKSGHQPKEFYLKLWSTITNGQTWRGELRNKKKNGEFYWEEAVISPLSNKEGKITHYIAVKNDITLRRVIERKLQTNQNILNQTEKITKTGGWSYNVEKNKIDWTLGLYQVHDIDPSEETDLINESLKCYTKEDSEKIKVAFENCIKTGEGYDFTVPFTSKKGNKKWVRTRTKALIENKKVIRVFGTVADITNHIDTTKQLKENEQFKSSVLEALTEGLVVQDKNGKIVIGNTAASEILGLSMNQLIGKDSYDPLWQATDIDGNLLKPEEHPVLITLKTGKSVKGFVMWVNTGLNQKKIILVNSSPILNEKGKADIVVTSFVDITESENNKIELFEAKQQIESIFQNANVAIGVSDLKGNFTQFNEAFLKVFDIKENEVLNTNIGALTHPDFLPKETKLLSELLKGEIESYRLEKIILTPKGEKWINLSATAVKNQKGEITNFIGAAIDISENKKNEFELKNSQTLLEKSQEIAKLGSWEYDFKTDTVKWSKALYEIYEYPHELPAPKYESEQKSFYTENTYKDLDKALKDCINSGKSYNLEFKIITFKGNEKHIISIGQAKKDINNNVVSIVGTAQDITERKKLDLELLNAKEIAEKSQTQLKYAIDGTQAATWDWNIKTGEVEFNERWAEIMGYTLQELEPFSIDTWEKFSHPEDFKKSNTLLQKHFNKEIEYYDFKTRLKHKNGKWIWVWDRGKVVEWDENQQPIRMVGTHMDINNWVKAEEKLIENETKFRLIYQSTSLGTGYYDTNGNIINYNHIALKNINKKAIDVEGKNITEIFPGDSGIEFLRRIKKTIEENKSWITKDCVDNKNNVWFESHYSPVTNKLGNVIGVLIISFNISEKVKAEKQIIESEEKYRFLTESISEILWSADAEGNIDFVNKLGQQKLGKSLEFLIDNSWLSIIHDDDKEQVIDKWTESISNAKTFNNEQRMKVANGDYHWFKVSASPELNDKKKIQRWVGITIDIQKEKIAKLQSEKQKKELEFLAKHAEMFLNATTVKNIFETLVKGMYELLQSSTIVFSAKYYNDGKNWKAIAFEGYSNWMNAISNVFDFSKMNGETNPSLYLNTKKRSVVDLGGDVHELSLGSVSKIAANVINKMLPKFTIKAINIFSKNELFGNVSFLEFKDTPKIDQNLLFTFIDQASTALEKLVAVEDLEESNLRFELATSATRDVVWDWDLNTNNLYRGGSFVKVFGDLPAFGNNEDWLENIHTEDKEICQLEMKRCIESKTTKELYLEYRFKRADNTYAWVTDQATILRDKEGKAYRIIGAMKDMTETKQFMEAIQRQNKRLKTISWIQSHELRAPLSRILGIAELLKEKDLDKDLFEELVENIVKSSNELDLVVKEIVTKADLN